MIDYRLDPFINRLWALHEQLKQITVVQMTLRGRGVDSEMQVLREEILSEMVELIQKNEEGWHKYYGVTHHHRAPGNR